jgi:hypothetical protein
MAEKRLSTVRLVTGTQSMVGCSGASGAGSIVSSHPSVHRDEAIDVAAAASASAALTFRASCAWEPSVWTTAASARMSWDNDLKRKVRSEFAQTNSASGPPNPIA